MNISKKSSFVVLLAALTMGLASCSGGNDNSYRVVGDYFTGKVAKKDYKAFLGSGITTLNYLKSQNGADAKHVANFVDGLVMNDEYGILRNQIAKSATHSTDNKVFEFQIRDDAKWYTSDGNVFKNEGQDVYVTAEDFVTSAEIVLNAQYESELYYLACAFFKGGWEYYCYTLMNQLIINKTKYPSGGTLDPNTKASYNKANPAPDKNCKFDYGSLKKGCTDDEFAAQLTNLIAYESNKAESECLVLGSEIQDIKDFKRVGVKADGNKLTYTLVDGMSYFPTVLTYCPFLPVNKAFYQQHKSSFGTTKDDILYNGPYLLSKWDGSEIQYVKNNEYFNASDVHIDTVNYKIIETDISASYIREQFNEGNTDAFGLSTADVDGWKMYIGGEDNSGTYENPVGTVGADGTHYADYVNARELDDIDYLYAFNTNMSRDSSLFNSSKKNSDLTAAEIDNCNRALHLKEVRAMLLDGVNLDIYGNVFVEQGGAETVDQYAVNTLVPKGFALDENDKDYTTYYFEKYAEKEEITVEQSTNMWKQQQYANLFGYSDTPEGYAKFKAERQEPAIDAINKYNAAIDAGELHDKEGVLLTAADKITFPVKIECLTSGALSADYKKYDNAWIENLNEKINGVHIYRKGIYSNEDIDLAEAESYPYFIVSSNSTYTQANSSSYANNANFNFGLVMGWGPDYADPLTYMNCYVENGDMTKYTGYTADDKTYNLNDAGAIIEKEIAQEYTDLVVEAKQVNNDTKTRYEKFAEAEYVLHEDVKVVRPCYMSTQGWAASVSRAIGYENPNATYGLADNRLTGMWVLVDIPTRAERIAARAHQAELKAQEMAKGGLIQIF